MTNFSMYFQQIWHGTPGWATSEVPIDDIKSAVYRLKSFAQDATQAGWALAQGVPGGPDHLTLENF